MVCKLFNKLVGRCSARRTTSSGVSSAMVRDLDFEIDVVGVPLAREPDGLAMSCKAMP